MRAVRHISVAPDNTVAVAVQGGGVYLVTGDAATELRSPSGEPLSFAVSVTFDQQGRLWIVYGARRRGELIRMLVRREIDGSWTYPARSLPKQPYRVMSLDERILVATDDQVFELLDDEIHLPLFRIARVRAVVAVPGGLWAAGKEEVLFYDGERTRRPKNHDVAWDLAARDGVVYGFNSHALYRIADDTMEALGSFSTSDGLIDAEGSLWVAGPSGLKHFPEPETLGLGDSDGIPTGSSRFVTKDAAGRIWVTTWQQTGLVGEPDVSYQGAAHQPCSDGFGALWISAQGRMVRRAGDGERDFATPIEKPYGRCARARDGTVWFARSGHLVRTGPPSSPVPTTYQTPFRGRFPFAVLEDRQGRLWLGGGDRICVANAAAVRARTATWRCPKFAAHANAEVTDFVHTEHGEIWASVIGEGVMRFDGSTFRLIESSRDLGSRWLKSLVPSPRGGVWVLGRETFVRVSTAPDSETWTVLEAPSVWNGMLSTDVGHLIEEPDGTLIASTVSSPPVLFMPPHARFAQKLPPRIISDRISVDGVSQGGSETVDVGTDARRIQLEFRALSYRAASSLVYRVRTSRDGAWSAPQRSATFQLLNPAAGDHYIEASTSVDGVNWQPVAAKVEIRVARAWYLRWWAWLAYAAIVLGLLYLAHRARVVMLLKLERQRTAIARDLHDEIGSGVGSIGILAEVANGAALSDNERFELTTRIQETAAELGESLSNIVWSLRVESERVAALPDYLRQRGSALFAGRGTEFRAQFATSLPGERMDLQVRRNVQLIALEAMHNAAKHAEAGVVEVGLEPVADGYRLWVRDNGRGFDPATGGDGLGLGSMESRAAEIAALLRLESSPGQGTQVELSFRPH